MNSYLAAEPQVDADATFRNFMRHNLGRAATHFDVEVSAPLSFGWRLRSVGAAVVGAGSAGWLRVVSEETEWARDNAWTGNLDANAITGVVKPSVLDVFEWAEGDWRNQRAELMTKIPGESCSPTDVLRAPVNVLADWWDELRRTLDTLSAVSTERTYADQAHITARIHSRFGDRVDTTVTQWTTAHGDLHWSNLMRPRFGVLDWELWGRAPAGTDAATLLCYSLPVPGAAERVRAEFADVLGTPTGRVAQLYVIARLLRRIDGGDYPELATPLGRLARGLLGSG